MTLTHNGKIGRLSKATFAPNSTHPSPFPAQSPGIDEYRFVSVK